MSSFFPGQRVLCIDGKFPPSVWDWVNEVPLEGEVYTVAWIRARGHDKVTGKIGPALALKEVSGTLPGVKSVVCWCIWRFAPLDLNYRPDPFCLPLKARGGCGLGRHRAIS
jgi:hypothetical protein